MVIYFATSNLNKFNEAKEMLTTRGITVEHFLFKHNEIRSDSIEEIANESVSVAHAQLKKSVFVEDTGLFIDALNGFPGTYSAWAAKKLGSRGILKLMGDEKNRVARFSTSIAFMHGKTIKTFSASCEGRISENTRGESGFSYDSIFIPEGYGKTFAESIGLKNKLSHRYQSLLLLSEYLLSNKL
ncbi:MAG: XTP/dITP diphosphatase [Candidatus Micrarchaeota archaeon]|nr:XTP/dITP diphosphatase [Candidatus Micrarchaeota archaeon]